jgi:hypothetical protein
VSSIAPRPVLVIHNEADAIIPAEHSWRLAAAYPKAQGTIMDLTSTATGSVLEGGDAVPLVSSVSRRVCKAGYDIP